MRAGAMMNAMTNLDGLDSRQLVRLLAEPARRRVAAALILDAGTAEDIARRSRLPMREVVESLSRLEAAGLVERGSDGTLVLLEAAFSIAARDERDPVEPSEHADLPREVARVLDRCFRNGRLVEWPAKRSLRLLVLERLAQEFEPGVRYSERDVNAILARFEDDTATSRRYLIDERFLDRADGVYWRSGGAVDTSPSGPSGAP